MTRRILLVIPDLEYSGTATRLVLLARGLAGTPFQPQVCVLGRAGRIARMLRSAAVEVTALEWQRLIDLNALRRLRHSVASFQPHVIHVWQPASLRTVVTALGRKRGRLIGSSVLEKRRPTTVLEWGQRWFVHQVDHVVASHPGEAQRYRDLGLAETRIHLIPPGTAPSGRVASAGESGCRSLGLPDGTPLLVCVGPLEPHKGFRDAIWAFDILNYLGQDWHLVVIGDGSDRARLEEFTRVLQATNRIHFVGPQADLLGLLAQAEVVWIPSRTEGGVQVALEAMSVARPVIASRLPDLAEVVVDGETGFLIAPGDKVGLARQTRVLLEDAQLRARMGVAGRERVASHFSDAAWVQHWVRLYETALAS